MSGIFDIDTKGQRELDQRARLNPLDLSQPPAPGFFTNFFGGAGSGFMEGAANTGNLFLTAAHDARNLWNPTPADFGPDVDILHPPKAVQKLTAPKTTLTDLGRDAVDYWAPNPATTGTAGQVVGGFLQMAVPLMAGGGNPGLFVESGYLHTKQELEREGVDSATATRAGLIEGVVNLAGFKVPILGKTLLSRLATGAAGNVLFGAGASELQKVNLEAGGYDDLASQYNPADLKARAVDTLMGLAFGGLHHVMVPTRVKDAVLTATNAEHFEQSSLPDYDHATPGQQARGQHALEQALRQVLHGEPVDVAGRFKPEDSGMFSEPAPGRALRRRLEREPDQLFNEYAKLPDSEGGRVLNTDTARELSPEYLADRTRSADVHEAASDTIKAMYAKKLSEPTPAGFDRSVLFTAGGTGAGKSTAVRAMEGIEHPPEIVYDTNMNTLSSAERKIEQALAAGRDVQILYVYRDPVDALVNGALPRAERQAREFGSGRTVPIGEHAKTHLGVRSVIEALSDKYRDDPRVEILAFDNSRGKGNGRLVKLADVPRLQDNNLREQLQEALQAEHEAGRISNATFAGFAQGESTRPQGVQRTPVQGFGGQPQPQRDEPGSLRGEATSRTDQDAARQLEDLAGQVVAKNPDLPIILDDGATVTVREALEQADQGIQQAEAEAPAFEAAAACAMRFLS